LKSAFLQRTQVDFVDFLLLFPGATEKILFDAIPAKFPAGVEQLLIVTPLKTKQRKWFSLSWGRGQG